MRGPRAKSFRPKPTVEVDPDELLKLLDHVESHVRWASVSMVDKTRYYNGAHALWAVVHRIAGDHKQADELKSKIAWPAR